MDELADNLPLSSVAVVVAYGKSGKWLANLNSLSVKVNERFLMQLSWGETGAVKSINWECQVT